MPRLAALRSDGWFVVPMRSRKGLVAITMSRLAALGNGSLAQISFSSAALASKKWTPVKRVFLVSCIGLFGRAGGSKQNSQAHYIVWAEAIKVLLATRPRALLRSTLTAVSCAQMRC